jgi:hypothetical protein
MFWSHHALFGKTAGVSIGLHDDGSRIRVVSADEVSTDPGLGNIRRTPVEHHRIPGQEFFVLFRHDGEIDMRDDNVSRHEPINSANYLDRAAQPSPFFDEQLDQILEIDEGHVVLVD